MTVDELIEALADFGGHLTVVVRGTEYQTAEFSVKAGRDDDGVAACIIEQFPNG